MPLTKTNNDAILNIFKCKKYRPRISVISLRAANNRYWPWKINIDLSIVKTINSLKFYSIYVLPLGSLRRLHICAEGHRQMLFCHFLIEEGIF